MKIDYKKLVNAESRLNEWAVSLPIAEGTEVELRQLSRVWRNGWDAGWDGGNMDIVAPETIKWDNEPTWSLDWYFNGDYEVIDNEEVQLTIRISWGEGDIERSEEWSVWDTELTEEF